MKRRNQRCWLNKTTLSYIYIHTCVSSSYERYILHVSGIERHMGQGFSVTSLLPDISRDYAPLYISPFNIYSTSLAVVYNISRQRKFCFKRARTCDQELWLCVCELHCSERVEDYKNVILDIPIRTLQQNKCISRQTREIKKDKSRMYNER